MPTIAIFKQCAEEAAKETQASAPANSGGGDRPCYKKYSI